MNRPEIFDRVREAFDRGRWVMMTDSGGAPQEITLDLKERPDDLFGPMLRGDMGQGQPFPSDDHGPAVPAQGDLKRSADVVGADGLFVVREPGPVVYEFSIQQFNVICDCPQTLDSIDMGKVNLWGPYQITGAAHAADWVHVYDEVTRERRTLKRPPADAVLTGMADVAADLRGSDWPRDGVASRAMADPAVDTEFPPAQPAPGPLTSTDGLLPGDVLMFEDRSSLAVAGFRGDLVTGDDLWVTLRDGSRGLSRLNRLRFVGRPDADGWMDWPGGENPVPGAVVEIDTVSKGTFNGPSEHMNWVVRESGYSLVRFRLVDMPPLTGDA